MTTPVRTPVVPLLRMLLWAGAVFVFAAGTQLYLLSGHTDRFFAWTIANPFTAAVLGAFYYGAVVIAGLSARRTEWAMARSGVAGILVFVWLTLIASLLHLSVLHLHNAAGSAWLAAVAWLVIYVADPPLLLLAVVLQLRRRRGDPPRAAPMPGWLRTACAALAVPVFVSGAVGFVRPSAGWAPWSLTPIASQALAAWFVALGGLLVSVVVEADWRRVRPAMAGVVVLAVLQLGAEVRYPDAVHGFASVWWSGLWTVLLALGGYGLIQDRRAAASVHSGQTIGA